MLLRSRPLLRCFHSSRRLLQEEVSSTSSYVTPKLGKGKKIAPKKQSLVILNARQSNILRERKVPKHFQSSSAEEESPVFNQDKSLELLNSSRSRKLTQSENFKILEQLKPTKVAISKKRSEQLYNDISRVFTIKQLRMYILERYPDVILPRSYTKAQVLDKLIKDAWKIEINDTINPREDFIVQRVFDFKPRELFLLWRKKAFDDWIRANVEIVIQPEELRVIVKATEPHIQYIEISIDKILKNIKSEETSLENIVEISKENDIEVPLLDVQRLSGVYLETHVAQAEDGEATEQKKDDYMMYSFGNRGFADFKRMILWALDHNSFIKSNIHADFDSPQNKLFNLFTDQSLPWVHRRKQWLRLREPRTLKTKPAPIKIDSEKIYDELYTSVSPEVTTPSPTQQSITAVSLGHLLFRESSIKKNDKKYIMNTNIPFAHRKILKLPLYKTTEDDFDAETLIDYHSYFAQLKFLPSPYNDSDNFKKYPPIEFWFDIDENESAKIASLQVLSVTNEINSIVSLPAHPTDVKFIKSDSELLVEPSDGSDNWLSDQPGIKTFLESARLVFDGSRKVAVPDSVEIKLPGVDNPVKYDYVNLSYRQHLDLNYNGRLLQYSTIEGGALGGRTSEIIIIGKDSVMDKEEFATFTKDTAEFIESLNE